MPTRPPMHNPRRGKTARQEYAAARRTDPVLKRLMTFYSCTRWKTLRRHKRNKDPLCEPCKDEGRIAEPMTDVHHVTPIRTPEGWERRFDLDGLVSVCKAHHAQLDAQERTDARTRTTTG